MKNICELSLKDAQSYRDDIILDERINKILDLKLSHADVGPEARKKLRHLLKFYAKKRHPFRACVRDNMKRFGPGRTERICATVKDLIKGTHKWRKGNQKFSQSDQEVINLIDKLSEQDLREIIGVDV